jgi:hypothetical protein
MACDPRPGYEASMSEVPADDTSDPRCWKKDGWIAKVVKNLDDDGWAVEMTQFGESEPALVGPWTMGRDKKNPKPLDQPSFMTLVKTANEVLLRHAQSARARLHKSLSFESTTLSPSGEPIRVRADCDIAPDDDDPHAILSIFDDTTNEELRRGRVSPAFKLSAANVERWARTGEG